ncbi:MAG: anthranilate synthase component I family protein [Oligoflexia bacterium]|nr:anthranilate synthase component I family protein [Oligoflexia bacterium]
MKANLIATETLKFTKRGSTAAIVSAAVKTLGHLTGFALLQGRWLPGSLSVRGTLIFLEPIAACVGPEELDLVIQSCADLKLHAVPFACGFVTYEYLHRIEPTLAPRFNEELSPFLFRLYRRVILIPDDPRLEATCFTLEYAEKTEALWHAQDSRMILNPEVDGSKPASGSLLDVAVLQDRLASYSNFTVSEYKAAVETVRQLIYQGEVYQINFTQRFRLPIAGTATDFWLKLAAFTAPAYGAFLRVSPECAIASASPELFLDRGGRIISASPIKGTRPRAPHAEEDQRLVRELHGSVKDRAELAMIVDLIRNDLGRIAEVGSVRVKEHARIESLSYVHQLVSDISATLLSGRSFTQILAALFPCGSITGAPKIAAMRNITSLERCARGIYTGGIGYLATNGDFRLNVAIRTAVVNSSTVTFSAGGGIVWESDPQEEYCESLAKAAGLGPALDWS